jgi:hypothetical protein
MRMAQGEITLIKISAIPADATETVAAEKGRYVVGHSESGNCHVLDAENVTIVRRPGANILYAIVADPTMLRQEKSGTPHAPVSVPAGIYKIVISREFNPFTEQARRVAD